MLRIMLLSAFVTVVLTVTTHAQTTDIQATPEQTAHDKATNAQATDEQAAAAPAFDLSRYQGVWERVGPVPQIADRPNVFIEQRYGPLIIKDVDRLVIEGDYLSLNEGSSRLISQSYSVLKRYPKSMFVVTERHYIRGYSLRYATALATLQFWELDEAPDGMMLKIYSCDTDKMSRNMYSQKRIELSFYSVLSSIENARQDLETFWALSGDVESVKDHCRQPQADGTPQPGTWLYDRPATFRWTGPVPAVETVPLLPETAVDDDLFGVWHLDRYNYRFAPWDVKLVIERNRYFLFHDRVHVATYHYRVLRNYGKRLQLLSKLAYVTNSLKWLFDSPYIIEHWDIAERAVDGKSLLIKSECYFSNDANQSLKDIYHKNASDDLLEFLWSKQLGHNCSKLQLDGSMLGPFGKRNTEIPFRKLFAIDPDAR